MISSSIFNSVFSEEFQNLVEYKRALGFKYITEEGQFKRIDKFLCDCSLITKEISKEISDLWCKKRSYETVCNHANRVSAFRVFCVYLNSIGINAYIPIKGLVRRGPKYDVHIYTKNELVNFFKAVDESKSVKSSCPYRHLVMPIFFRILYTSGLRVSELRLAKVCDFNLDKGYLTVNSGKNNKDRIVPIHPYLVSKCIELKNEIHQNSLDDEYFFMMKSGYPMSLNNIYRNFRRYLEKANITHTGKGPRVHDFRHTYCINLLIKWIKEDKDLLNYMPYMKTILGHETFSETAYYLKLTATMYPALMVKLEISIPNMIEKVVEYDEEFY